jgi:hypothetical protein
VAYQEADCVNIRQDKLADISENCRFNHSSSTRRADVEIVLTLEGLDGRVPRLLAPCTVELTGGNLPRLRSVTGSVAARSGKAASAHPRVQGHDYYRNTFKNKTFL